MDRHDAQERDAAALLRPLAREPRFASTVDIARAVADGERRLRTVRLVGSGGVALLVVLALLGGWLVLRPEHRPAPVDRNSQAPTTSVSVPGPSASPTEPAAPGSCTAQRLPVPSGHPDKSVVTGGDPSGRYLVGRSFPGGTPHPVIWDGGVVREVPMAGTDGLLRDINTNGVAVGSSLVDSSSKRTAWAYHDGQLSRLAGTDGRANGVNEQGVIVGSVDGKPARWASPTSQPTMLQLPAGADGEARGIDEDGTVVGEVRDKAGSYGYLWHVDGSGERLRAPTLAGKPSVEYSADAIREGWVIGWAAEHTSTGTAAGARWNLRTGEMTSFPGTTLSAVNRHGWVVGDESGEGGSAVLLTGQSKLILRAQEGPGRDHGAIATFIGDDGTLVAGQSPTDAGVMAALRWTCR